MPIDYTSTLHKIEESTWKSHGCENINNKCWLEAISLEPRAFIYHNFLTNEECEHLISLAKPNMVRSRVSSSLTHLGVESSVRTSTGTFFRKGHDKIVKEIEKRISDFTFIPKENGEGLQVIHYEVGQKFEPHYDYSTDELTIKSGGPRVATVLMYLSDVEEDGGTVFPNAKGNEFLRCGKKGLTVLPKKRDALLFWSMKPDTTLDPSSKHGGLPVIKGNKWACTKWFRLNESKSIPYSRLSNAFRYESKSTVSSHNGVSNALRSNGSNPTVYLHNQQSNTFKRPTSKIESPIEKKTKKETKDKEVVVEIEKPQPLI